MQPARLAVPHGAARHAPGDGADAHRRSDHGRRGGGDRLRQPRLPGRPSSTTRCCAIAERIAGVPSDLTQINKRSVHRAFDVWGARAAIRAGTELQALAGHTETAARVPRRAARADEAVETRGRAMIPLATKETDLMPMPSKHDPERAPRRLREALSEHSTVRRHRPVAAPRGHRDVERDAAVRPRPRRWLTTSRRPACARRWTTSPCSPSTTSSKQARIMRLVGEQTDVPVPGDHRRRARRRRYSASRSSSWPRVDGEALPDMMPYTLGGSFLDEFTPDERSEFRTYLHVGARPPARDRPSGRRSLVHRAGRR